MPLSMDNDNKHHPNVTVTSLEQYAKQNLIAGAEPDDDCKSQQSSTEDAIEIIKAQPPNAIVVVGGAIGTAALRSLAERCNIAYKILEPHSKTTVRSATLPSRPRDFLSVQLITIGRYVQKGVSTPLAPSKEIRDIVAKQLAKYTDKCASGAINSYDHIRSIKFYGQNYLSVEQNATFVSLPIRERQRDEEWSGLLLNDVGRGTQHSAWHTRWPLFHDAEFIPIMVRDFAARPFQAVNGAAKPATRPDPFNSRRADDDEAGPSLVHESGLHFAADLLTTSALSWSQFLAFLRSAMLKNLPDEDPAECLRLLNQARGHLGDAVCYFDETLAFLDGVSRHGIVRGQPRGLANTTTTTTTTTRRHTHSVSRTAAKPGNSKADNDGMIFGLKRDFCFLRADGLEVSNMCKEKIEAINSTIALETSMEALQEGKRMTLITYLAVGYAALALSSSIFGMNVKGLGGSVPVYYFVILSGVIVGLSISTLLIFGKYRVRAALLSLQIWNFFAGLFWRILQSVKRSGRTRPANSV